MKEFKYEIKKKIAVLSENEKYATEVNLISYNGAEAKVDIRKWAKEDRRMLKGVVLSVEEAKNLLEALKEL